MYNNNNNDNKNNTNNNTKYWTISRYALLMFIPEKFVLEEGRHI